MAGICLPKNPNKNYFGGCVQPTMIFQTQKMPETQKKGKRMKEDFEKEEQLKPFRETNVEQNTRYFNIRI